MIARGRGEGETLSIHLVSTQCARGLIEHIVSFLLFSRGSQPEKGGNINFHIILLICSFYISSYRPVYSKLFRQYKYLYSMPLNSTAIKIIKLDHECW